MNNEVTRQGGNSMQNIYASYLLTVPDKEFIN